MADALDSGISATGIISVTLPASAVSSVNARSNNPPSMGADPTAPDDDAVRSAMDKVNAKLAAGGQSLRLSVDTQSHHLIIVVRDTTTGDVLRQIPNEEVLRLASNATSDSSALVDTEA